MICDIPLTFRLNCSRLTQKPKGSEKISVIEELGKTPNLTLKYARMSMMLGPVRCYIKLFSVRPLDRILSKNIYSSTDVQLCTLNTRCTNGMADDRQTK